MHFPDEAIDAGLRSLAVWLIGQSPLASDDERERAAELVADAKRAVAHELIVALGTIRDQVTANMRKQQAITDEATLLDNPDFVEWDAGMEGFYE